MRIVAALGYGCNAACAHCCNDSGPRRRGQKLSEEDVRNWAKLAKELGQEEISVTGGEPFVYPDLLKVASEEAAAFGRGLGVRTNAFWATSEQAVRDALARYPSIREFRSSIDSYHQARIPVGNVANLISAVSEANFSGGRAGDADPDFPLNFILTVLDTPAKSGEQALDGLLGGLRGLGWTAYLTDGLETLGVGHENGHSIRYELKIGQVAPYGRAKDLAGLGETPRLRCMAYEPLLLSPEPDGTNAIYPCCAVEAFFPENAIARFPRGEMITKAGLEEAVGADAVSSALRRDGAGSVEARLASAGVQIPTYAAEGGACSICRYLKTLPECEEKENAYALLAQYGKC